MSKFPIRSSFICLSFIITTMPPILMIFLVVFTVVLIMIGESPIDKWKREQEKYGKDPLAREINKFNEKTEKGNSGESKYQPPPGATVYRLPPNEILLQPGRELSSPLNGDNLVRPAPDIPFEQWGSGYPSYMMAPKSGAQNEVMTPNNSTSLVPGRAPQ